MLRLCIGRLLILFFFFWSSCNVFERCGGAALDASRALEYLDLSTFTVKLI